MPSSVRSEFLGRSGRPDSDPEKIHLRLLPFGPDRVQRDSARADLPPQVLVGYPVSFKVLVLPSPSRGSRAAGLSYHVFFVRQSGPDSRQLKILCSQSSKPLNAPFDQLYTACLLYCAFHKYQLCKSNMTLRIMQGFCHIYKALF